MAYQMPACFESWKAWHECLTGKRICTDHRDGNAIVSRVVKPVEDRARGDV